MNDREYAAHRKRLNLPGGTRQAVAKARRTKRLKDSLGPDGLVRDALEADREWLGNTESKGQLVGALMRAENGAGSREPAPIPPDFTVQVVAELRRVVESVHKDETDRLVDHYGAEVVTGAAAALAEAGRVPTLALLLEVLRLDDLTDEDAGIEVVGPLTWDIAQLDDPADGREAARDLGYESARKVIPYLTKAP